ncbi:hypothetical protein B4064_3864 [Caldibacillus thermoamylovorans]|nr:hypothetical protein B4064_3864 [Caldibacillus thermoamylovorans]
MYKRKISRTSRTLKKGQSTLFESLLLQIVVSNIIKNHLNKIFPPTI